jgi:putative MATE family efflux protein
MFVELILGIGVGLVSTALAARLSDTSAAAFSLAHHVFAMLFILFRVVGAGVGVVVAQCLGAGQREAADAVARASFGASTWMGVMTALPALVAAVPLLQALNAPAEVLRLAAPFLQALAPAMVLDAWNACMSTVLRSHLRVREALGVVVAMHAVHLTGAVLWMPSLGLDGFVLALLASRLLGTAVHLFLWRRVLGLRVVPSDAWRLRRSELAEVLRIGLPGAAENVAWRLAFMVSVSVVGTLGASALATHTYVQQLGFLVVMASLAIGLSVEIVVGHLVGAGQLHEAHRLVRRSMAVGLSVSLGLAGALALSGPWLLRGFTADPGILATGALLLWWTVLLEPGRTFNLVVINALRATGDARYPVVAGAASMALVLAGGSWLLGSVLGLGLVGVWMAYAADEWVRGLLMWRRWTTQRWVPHARAARRRVSPAARAPRPRR